jgi:predicted cation transporter
MLGFFYFVDLLFDFIFVNKILFSLNAPRSTSRVLNDILLAMIGNSMKKMDMWKTRLDFST